MGKKKNKAEKYEPMELLQPNRKPMDLKVCPFCHRPIYMEAENCPYCLAKLEESHE